MTSEPKRDADLVVEIIDQLKEGGPLRDPRSPPDDRTPLEAHVAWEVQRSIDRVRLLRTDWSPAALAELRAQHGLEPVTIAEPVTLADLRKAARLLRDASAALHKVALFDDHRLAVPEIERISQELEGVRQIPPERAHALKYRSAAEAFDLMSISAKPPTGSNDGAFRIIAARIYAAVNEVDDGEKVDDIKRACDLVLADRKKYNPNAFKRS